LFLPPPQPVAQAYNLFTLLLPDSPQSTARRCVPLQGRCLLLFLPFYLSTLFHLLYGPEFELILLRVVSSDSSPLLAGYLTYLSNLKMEAPLHAVTVQEDFTFRYETTLLICVAVVRTNVSEECIASIIRVTRIVELGTMLSLTSQRPSVTAYC
jgi:hypothetical protein